MPTPPFPPPGSPYLSADPIAANDFQTVRLRTIFECAKWDPQVGDTAILSPYPLIIREEHWRYVSSLASLLARETLEAEDRLRRSREAQALLALPPPLPSLLRSPYLPTPPPAPIRFMRFDFHFTLEGWRISEVNADVPGGLNEASGFTRLMGEYFPALSRPGDPTASLASAFASLLPRDALVGLVHATPFTDDRQVMSFLGRALEAKGIRAVLIGPEGIRWQDGAAFVKEESEPTSVRSLLAHFSRPFFGGKARAPIKAPVKTPRRLDALYRFFPAEWLPDIGRKGSWSPFFFGARLPLCNPGTSLFVQSKRFPLTWPLLELPLPTWRMLLPETCDPRAVTDYDSPSWVLKPALGRIGEDIATRGLTPIKALSPILNAVRKDPSSWVVQRRFQVCPHLLGGTPTYPCLGVYTLNEQVIGAYARAGTRPIVDAEAADLAVLIHPASAETDALCSPSLNDITTRRIPC